MGSSGGGGKEDEARQKRRPRRHRLEGGGYRPAETARGPWCRRRVRDALEVGRHGDAGLAPASKQELSAISAVLGEERVRSLGYAVGWQPDPESAEKHFWATSCPFVSNRMAVLLSPVRQHPVNEANWHVVPVSTVAWIT